MEKANNSKDDLELFKCKQSFLVLGGLGFIGKTLVEQIIQLDCFSKLVIVDKKMLKLNSYVPKAKFPLYEDPKIVILQKDLSKEQDVKPIFSEYGPFDYVINVAGESRLDLGEESHKRNSLKLTSLCAAESAENKVKKFIYLSSAFVYESSSKPLNENGKLDPKRTQAIYCLAAERALFRIPNLDYIVLRPSYVYGTYDLHGYVLLNLMSAFCYKINRKKMAVLWDNNLKTNVVHVNDVCRAIFYAIEKGRRGDIYNLANEENLTQNKFYDHLRKIFKVEIECVGTFKTYLAKLKFDSVIAEFNDIHMRWWLQACQAAGINNTPLNILVQREMLEHHDLCIDGSAIKKIGFAYKYPRMLEDEIREQLKYLIESNIFPDWFKMANNF